MTNGLDELENNIVRNIKEFFVKLKEATLNFQTLCVFSKHLNEISRLVRANNTYYQELKIMNLFQEPILLTSINKSMNKINDFCQRHPFEKMTEPGTPGWITQMEIISEYLNYIKQFE